MFRRQLVYLQTDNNQHVQPQSFVPDTMKDDTIDANDLRRCSDLSDMVDGEGSVNLNILTDNVNGDCDSNIIKYAVSFSLSCVGQRSDTEFSGPSLPGKQFLTTQPVILSRLPYSPAT